MRFTLPQVVSQRLFEVADYPRRSAWKECGCTPVGASLEGLASAATRVSCEA